MAKRETSIELLRIILMAMVVTLHVLNHGILSPDTVERYSNTAVFSNYSLAHLLESFTVFAVDGFILISGYFAIRFKTAKFIRLVFMMWFYCIVIYLLFILFGIQEFSFIGLIKYNIPLFWWFMYYYLILMLASPILNTIVDKLSKGQFRLMLVVMGLLFCIVPTLSPMSFTNDRGFGIVNFIFIYFIGRYIGIYCREKHWSKLISWGGYLLCALLIFTGNLVLRIAFHADSGWKSHFYGYDNLFVILGAVCLFQAFRSIPINDKRLLTVIPRISAATLGIYLIHEHYLVRTTIYSSLLRIDRYFSNSLFIPSVLIEVILVFSVCAILELLRIKLTRRFENSLIDFLESKNHFARIKTVCARIFNAK